MDPVHFSKLVKKKEKKKKKKKRRCCMKQSVLQTLNKEMVVLTNIP
jgi:hypothetical protein